MKDIKEYKDIEEHKEIKDEIIQELEENSDTIKSIISNLSDEIANTVKLIINSYKNDGKVILMGNGGSAADAQHIAAEFIGRFKLERNGLPAIALTTNTSIITAIANDYGYDMVFSRQLESLAENGDILIAISTSGNSPNILRGIEIAKSKKIKIVGMTGRSGGKMKYIVDILINIPSDNTPRIQEAHITIGHIICGIVETHLFRK